MGKGKVCRHIAGRLEKFNYVKENPLFIVFDELQNFESVDPSVFLILQNHWDREKDDIKGAFVFIVSVFTLMQKIFEGKKEPLFGRATSRLYIEPFTPLTVSEMLADYRLDAPSHLPFYYTLFGGIPKYYFLLYSPPGRPLQVSYNMRYAPSISGK